MTLSQYAAAGFFSAIPMTVITAPFERIKIVLQIQGQHATPGQKQYTGGFDALRGIYKEGGLRSGIKPVPLSHLVLSSLSQCNVADDLVFRGSAATLARDGPGSATYFAVYEYVKRRLTPPGESLSLPAVIMAGGLAGVAMWTLVFPVDTVKSALQASATPTSVPAVVKTLYARGGIGAFFPGLWPALARSFPANAATFLGVEMARKGLDTLF